MLMPVTAMLGLIATVVGIFGFYKDQPQDIYFPVLVVGVISMIIAPVIFTYAKQRYTELELRKMKSKDLK